MAKADVAQTAVFNRFFAPENIRYVQQQLEKTLTLMVGQPVRVPVTDEFMETMSEVAKNNQGVAYLGDRAVEMLNEMVVEWEARVQYVSINQQKRYKDWILDDNRLKFMPYPESDKTMRGETVVDTSGYMLTSPFRNQWSSCMKDVYGMHPTSAPSSSSKPVCF